MEYTEIQMSGALLTIAIGICVGMLLQKAGVKHPAWFWLLGVLIGLWMRL